MRRLQRSLVDRSGTVPMLDTSSVPACQQAATVAIGDSEGNAAGRFDEKKAR